jgi:hypothetical protein
VECVVWQPDPQHPGVAHSHPSVSGAVAKLQSAWFAMHVYEQVVPLQLSAVALAGLQVTPHPPQLLVVVVGVEQPAVLGGVGLQLAHPVAHT